MGLLVTVSPQLLRLSAVQSQLSKRLHPSVLGMLNPSILMTGLILLALAILGRNLATRMRSRRLAILTLSLLAATVPVLLLRWRVPLKTYATISSSSRLAERILSTPDRSLDIYGYYYFRTSLPFYLRRPIGLVTTDGNELTSNYVASRWPEMRQHARAQDPEQAPQGSLPPHRAQTLQTNPLLGGASFDALLSASAKPMLVMVRNTNVAELAQKAGRMESLWGAWEYSVWRIPAAKPGDSPGGQREWSSLPYLDAKVSTLKCRTGPSENNSIAQEKQRFGIPIAFNP